MATPVFTLRDVQELQLENASAGLTISIVDVASLLFSVTDTHPLHTHKHTHTQKTQRMFSLFQMPPRPSRCHIAPTEMTEG